MPKMYVGMIENSGSDGKDKDHILVEKNPFWESSSSFNLPKFHGFQAPNVPTFNKSDGANIRMSKRLFKLIGDNPSLNPFNQMKFINYKLCAIKIIENVIAEYRNVNFPFAFTKHFHVHVEHEPTLIRIHTI